MRDEGKTFFKESDVRNLNKYLDKFTKDDFFRKDGSKGFKLGPDAKKDLRQKLAV